MRRLSLNRSEPAKKNGQNIPKNRCRTTIPERMGETRAELPFIGDQVVCLSHNQAARSGPRKEARERWGRESSPVEESAGAGSAIVEAASQRVTRLGGILARRRPPTASPFESSNARTEHRSEQLWAPVSMNFGPQNCGAVLPTSAHDQVRRGWSKIITFFQWVLIFEQSVNHPCGPRC